MLRVESDSEEVIGAERERDGVETESGKVEGGQGKREGK